MKIGILALQGNVREHAKILNRLNAEPVLVKLPEDLDSVDGLIIPGGESTTIGLLMEKYGLTKAIKEKSKSGLPIYGTCAGAILLANDIIGSKQPKLGLLNISIERNAFGRQLDSFEANLNTKFGNLKGIFIRAPTIKNSNGAEVLAKYNDVPVMIRQNNILLTTFHPELANEVKVHKYFLGMVKSHHHNIRNT